MVDKKREIKMNRIQTKDKGKRIEEIIRSRRRALSFTQDLHLNKIESEGPPTESSSKVALPPQIEKEKEKLEM